MASSYPQDPSKLPTGRHSQPPLPGPPWTLQPSSPLPSTPLRGFLTHVAKALPWLKGGGQVASRHQWPPGGPLFWMWGQSLFSGCWEWGVGAGDTDCWPAPPDSVRALPRGYCEPTPQVRKLRPETGMPPARALRKVRFRSPRVLQVHPESAVSPPPCCVTLEKSPDLSGPQFLHLQSGGGKALLRLHMANYWTEHWVQRPAGLCPLL